MKDNRLKPATLKFDCNDSDLNLEFIPFNREYPDFCKIKQGDNDIWITPDDIPAMIEGLEWLYEQRN
ncbi:MAG: hypothetical protein AAF198_06395 [Pseudomonadota bacterium]